MLILGKDNVRILEHLPRTFLFIDDGDLIDRLSLPKRQKVTVLDFKRHSLNPLAKMDYRKARALIEIFDAAFPEGANTLTKKNSNFVLLKALLDRPKYLDTLIPESREPAEQDAAQKIETLLLSPLIKHFTCNPTNFSLTGTIVARLNRAELGDFDCLVIGNLLINAYPGNVVVSDYGTYVCPFHLSLIRQERLTVSVPVLDDLKTLKSAFLLRDITPARTTFDDATVLANASGKAAGTTEYSDFISAAMGG